MKGKALADSKLLKEYSVKDGDTVNLMVKAGVEWNQDGRHGLVWFGEMEKKVERSEGTDVDWIDRRNPDGCSE